MNKSRREVELLNIPKFILEDKPACAEVDPELFFPVETEIGHGKIVSNYSNLAEAKKICSSCPLTNKCLEYALSVPQAGVWGGTTEKQRELIKRRARYRASVKLHHS